MTGISCLICVIPSFSNSGQAKKCLQRIEMWTSLQSTHWGQEKTVKCATVSFPSFEYKIKIDKERTKRKGNRQFVYFSSFGLLPLIPPPPTEERRRVATKFRHWVLLYLFYVCSNFVSWRLKYFGHWAPNGNAMIRGGFKTGVLTFFFFLVVNSPPSYTGNVSVMPL